MNDQPIHRLYRHFQELPTSMRVLFTSALLVIGLGYVFALTYVFVAHAGRDGNPGLSVDDIIITYSGSAEGTQLESALQGPMSGMLPQADLAEFLEWVRAGADKAGYEERISIILEESCLSCHDGSNPHLTNLDGFENLQEVVKQDTGADLHTLVRVSHIHLFGLTFIFFIVGFIFSHAYVRPVWFKSAVMAAPFLAVTLDVSSWYFTKLYAPFGWVVLMAGGLMGMSFAFMWFVSMYQMWIYRVPDHVSGRNGNQE
jgi:hypothetical protein